MTELETLGKEYYKLLGQQQFVEEYMDYSVLDRHRLVLETLSQVNNSGLTIFDLFRQEHVYTSYNFTEIFGYDLNAIQTQGNDYFNSRVHPDDFVGLLKNGISIMQFFFRLPKEERPGYKLVNEYRILGSGGKYLRVIEQHQALELDNLGNVWLTLGVIDISPDQTDFPGIRSQIFNYKTGEVVALTPAPGHEDHVSLSSREKQVLQLVKDGLLSKEISEKLSISVHTVNTHRQRIMEKLGANNSLEAIAYASRLGLMR
jgi:DNA-binding CsgD family transcriptional regulator